MDYEQGKGIILEAMEAKKDRKQTWYPGDLQKILGLKPREAMKIINKMVEERFLVIWSSGSTSAYQLPGAGKQAHAEGEA